MLLVLCLMLSIVVTSHNYYLIASRIPPGQGCWEGWSVGREGRGSVQVTSRCDSGARQQESCDGRQQREQQADSARGQAALAAHEQN